MPPKASKDTRERRNPELIIVIEWRISCSDHHITARDRFPRGVVDYMLFAKKSFTTYENIVSALDALEHLSKLGYTTYTRVLSEEVPRFGSS